MIAMGTTMVNLHGKPKEKTLEYGLKTPYKLNGSNDVDPFSQVKGHFYHYWFFKASIRNLPCLAFKEKKKEKKRKSYRSYLRNKMGPVYNDVLASLMPKLLAISLSLSKNLNPCFNFCEYWYLFIWLIYCIFFFRRYILVIKLLYVFFIFLTSMFMDIHFHTMALHKSSLVENLVITSLENSLTIIVFLFLKENSLTIILFSLTLYKGLAGSQENGPTEFGVWKLTSVPNLVI